MAEVRVVCIRAQLEERGCPNCGALVQFNPLDGNQWRCSDQGCPESLEWGDVLVELPDFIEDLPEREGDKDSQKGAGGDQA